MLILPSENNGPDFADKRFNAIFPLGQSKESKDKGISISVHVMPFTRLSLVLGLFCIYFINGTRTK